MFNYHILKIEDGGINWNHFFVNENMVSIIGNVDSSYHIFHPVGFDDNELNVIAPNVYKVGNIYFFFMWRIKGYFARN